MSICYRWLREDDDLDAITDLLHEAYRPLAEAGMRYVATHQDVETTRRRMTRGETIVADVSGRIVGTVTFYYPAKKGEAPHYDDPSVAKCSQLAVDPRLQRRGIGSRLMDLAERRAREKGATELALDTSEHASHLIALYEKRGYRFIEYARWDPVNYRSVILSKSLRVGGEG